MADLSDTESEMSLDMPTGRKGEKRIRDSDDTDSEASASALPLERAGGERKRRPGRSGSVSSYDGDRTDRPMSPLPGTPAFIRVAELRKEKRAAMLKQKEERLESRAKEASVSRAALGLDTTDPRTAAALHQRVVDDVGVIMEMATKSTNLKGTVVRALKESAASIRVAVEALHTRTITEESAKLQAENARLQRDLVELRRELADLRTEFRKERAEAIRGSVPPPPRQASPERAEKPRGRRSEEQLTRSIMLQVGSMMGARLKELEERLLPGKRLRPPLSADRASAVAAADLPPGTEPLLPGATAPEPTPAGPRKPGPKKKKKGKGKKANAAGEAPPTQKKAAPRPLPSAPSSTGELWSTVTKRGAKSAAPPAPGGTKAAKAAKPRSRPAPEKLRPPKSSAVVVTLQPGALERGVTYAGVLSEARSKVDLASCNITGLRFKKAITGGCILEVPGATSGEKADAFAAKLREVMDPETVRVSRPERTADLRVSGLDDSVAVTEVVAAVAKGGGCPVAAVRAGEPRRDFRGSSTVWVRCPIAAAKRLAEGRRLTVGWTSAQVRLLEPRPMQCHRCLHKGHVQAKCTAEVDRSDECYRCGQPGHRASRCTAAAPKCSLCAAANKPSDHRVGSGKCNPPKTTKRAPTAQPPSSLPAQGGEKRKPATTAPPPPSSSPPSQGGEQMDTGPQTAASQPASAQETPLLRQMAEWLTNSGR